MNKLTELRFEFFFECNDLILLLKSYQGFTTILRPRSKSHGTGVSVSVSLYKIFFFYYKFEYYYNEYVKLLDWNNVAIPIDLLYIDGII